MTASKKRDFCYSLLFVAGGILCLAMATAAHAEPDMAATLAVATITNEDLYEETEGPDSLQDDIQAMKRELNNPLEFGDSIGQQDQPKKNIKYRYGHRREDYKNLPIPPRVFNNIK